MSVVQGATAAPTIVSGAPTTVSGAQGPATAPTAMSVARRTSAPVDGDTLHFKFSSHNFVDNHSGPKRSSTASEQQVSAPASPTPTPAHSRTSMYNGPNSYIKPQSRSNKKIIKNALCHVCLAGEVNASLKKQALAVSTINNMPFNNCYRTRVSKHRHL